MVRGQIPRCDGHVAISIDERGLRPEVCTAFTGSQGIGFTDWSYIKVKAKLRALSFSGTVNSNFPLTASLLKSCRATHVSLYC